MDAADGSTRRARRARDAVLARGHRSRFAAGAVALLALIAVSCSDAADDEPGIEDSATAAGDEADLASEEGTASGESGSATSDGSDPAAPDHDGGDEDGGNDSGDAGAGDSDDGDTGDGDTGDSDSDSDDGDGDPEPAQADGDEIDPFEELEWALTPAGPESPSVNEDSIYRVLDDLDPLRCQALLANPDDGWFDPSAFGTGERSVHLFRAGTLLCAGDTAAAETAYRRALDFEWPFAVEGALHSRVCNVWDAVTRMVDPGAGPCALEELPAEDPTLAEDDEAPEDPSTQTDSEGSTDIEEPVDPEEPADTEDAADADEPVVTEDSADESSDDDGGS